MSELGRQLAQTRQWEKAEDVWEEVEAIAETIEDSETRADILCKLGDVLARAQLQQRATEVWNEVEKVISTMENHKTRCEILSKLALNLAYIHELKRAESIAYQIEDNVIRAETLKELSRVLNSLGEHEQLLRLVQHCWLDAKTIEDAIEFFPLINGLIPLKPEISFAFYGAFAWVDDFLRETSSKIGWYTIAAELSMPRKK